MKSKAVLRCPFFADREDYAGLIAAILKDGELVMCRTSAEPGAEPLVFDRKSLPNVDEFINSRRPGLLIAHSDTHLEYRRVALADGSGDIRIHDQMLNPDTCRLKIGGEAGEDLLIQGMLDTNAETHKAKVLFQQIRDVIRMRGTKIKNVLVMPGALKKLEAGWRLAPGPNFRPEFDLTL